MKTTLILAAIAALYILAGSVEYATELAIAAETGR